MDKANIVSEIICAKYRYMPDALLLHYASKFVSQPEELVIRQEIISRGLTPRSHTPHS